jgi:hypothetical protein
MTSNVEELLEDIDGQKMTLRAEIATKSAVIDMLDQMRTRFGLATDEDRKRLGEYETQEKEYEDMARAAGLPIDKHGFRWCLEFLIAGHMRQHEESTRTTIAKEPSPRPSPSGGFGGGISVKYGGPA